MTPLDKLWIADVVFGRSDHRHIARGILGMLCVTGSLDESVGLQLHDIAAMPTFRSSSNTNIRTVDSCFPMTIPS